MKQVPLIPIQVALEKKQDSFESRRLWSRLSDALNVKDYDRAAVEKDKVEEHQRAMTKLREEENIEWRPKFFRRDAGGDFWHFVDRKALKESPEDLFTHLENFFAMHYGMDSSFVRFK